MNSRKKKKNNWQFLFLIILILLIILFIISGYFIFPDKERSHGKTEKTGIKRLSGDTGSYINGKFTEKPETAVTVKPDTGISQKQKADTKRNNKNVYKAESQKQKTEKELVDKKLEKAEDTESKRDPCDIDTIPPWVYPEPSGGLYYDDITVFLQSEEPCSLVWSLEDTAALNEYTGKGIKIEKSGTLYFRAYDSCKNALSFRDEFYEIKREPEKKGICPVDMALIEIGSTVFCIDRYEWPNERGKMPCSFVSFYEVRDSCYSVGKRLCSRDEWSLACRGAYSWNYPYGNEYEPWACNTRDTAVVKSGSKRECRGYFDVYDMSGNLAEWTDTRSKENRKFYTVMGGFFQSGPQSGCGSSKYSYFPRNRHNPVGFRCCRDIKNND